MIWAQTGMFIIALIVSVNVSASSIGFTDDLQRPVLAPANKVISLSPALTEMIYALGLGEKIAGVSEFSDYPAEARQKPSVGPYTKPIIEKIIALKPDLILLPIEGSEDVRAHF